MTTTAVRPLRREERAQLEEARRAIDLILWEDARGSRLRAPQCTAAVDRLDRVRPVLSELAGPGRPDDPDDVPPVAGPLGLLLACRVPAAVRAAAGSPLAAARDAGRLQVLVREVARRLRAQRVPATVGVVDRLAVAAAGDLYPDWFRAG